MNKLLRSPNMCVAIAFTGFALALGASACSTEADHPSKAEIAYHPINTVYEQFHNAGDYGVFSDPETYANKKLTVDWFSGALQSAVELRISCDRDGMLKVTRPGSDDKDRLGIPDDPTLVWQLAGDPACADAKVQPEDNILTRTDVMVPYIKYQS